MVLRSRRKSRWITPFQSQKYVAFTFPAKIVLGFSPLSLSLSFSLSLSLSSLSEDFTEFEHSNSGETYFSKIFCSLWRFSDDWTPAAVRNFIVFHCSTLTDTFCSLISLVELRQDWRSSQLPEREGSEATLPSKISNMLDGFYTLKKISPVYIWITRYIYVCMGQVAEAARNLPTNSIARVLSREVKRSGKFSSLRVQAGAGVHTGSYKMSTGCFPRCK